MALSDPQSVTVNAVAVSLPRIFPGNKYASADGAYTMTIDHQYKPLRTRHVVRIDHKKLADDPFVYNTGRNYSASFTFIIDAPAFGYDNASLGYMAQGLVDYLDVSGLLAKVLGGEV